jgi:hypothetical protein
MFVIGCDGRLCYVRRCDFIMKVRAKPPTKSGDVAIPSGHECLFSGRSWKVCAFGSKCITVTSERCRMMIAGQDCSNDKWGMAPVDVRGIDRQICSAGGRICVQS